MNRCARHGRHWVKQLWYRHKTGYFTGSRDLLIMQHENFMEDVQAAELAMYRPPGARKYRRQASWQEDASQRQAPLSEWLLTSLGRLFVFLLCFIIAMLLTGWLQPQLPGAAHVRTVLCAMLAGMLCQGLIDRT